MKHEDADGNTLLCRYCGREVTRLYSPGGVGRDGSVRLLAGTWFHAESKGRSCLPRQYAVGTTYAEPTQWTELDE